MSHQTNSVAAPWGLDSYARLASELQVLRGPAPEPDADLRFLAETVLHHEAHLLDSGDLEAWLGLMSPDCVYWVPANPDGGDPMTEVSLAFDDHRRVTDRVYWLRTGLVSAQIPPSRTTRVIGNVEAWRGEGDTLFVRSAFVLHEFRSGRQRVMSGHYGHVLTGLVSGRARDVRVRTKIAFLLDSDQGHDNLTLVF